MCERRREEREQDGRGRGCMDLAGYGTHRLPDCAPLSSFFEGEDKRKKNPGGGDNYKKGRGSECRDGGAPPVPPPRSPVSPPLFGLVWTEAGAAERSTLVWGFRPQQRDCHKTSLSASEGPCTAALSGML